jgi:hypothetical protein
MLINPIKKCTLSSSKDLLPYDAMLMIETCSNYPSQIISKSHIELFEKYRLHFHLREIKVTTLIIINMITSSPATMNVMQLNQHSLEGPSNFNIQENTNFI